MYGIVISGLEVDLYFPSIPKISPLAMLWVHNNVMQILTLSFYYCAETLSTVQISLGKIE